MYIASRSGERILQSKDYIVGWTEALIFQKDQNIAYFNTIKRVFIERRSKQLIMQEDLKSMYCKNGKKVLNICHKKWTRKKLETSVTTPLGNSEC